MSSLEHLIRFESAGSGLAFREAIYGPGDDALIVADCLALANAEIRARRRFLFLGVADVPGGERRLLGVDRRELAALKTRLLALVADAVEPALTVSVRTVDLDGRRIGFIRIKDCTQRPYLTRRAVGRELAAGVGLVRRGIRNMPLTRAEMQRLFAAQAAPEPAVAVRLYLAGREPAERIEVAVLSADRLPSTLARERLHALLTARDQARHVLGRTETRISRLVHAKLYGMDAPFESRSDASLLGALDTVAADYRAADAHYLHEVRAHKVNLTIVNRAERDLHHAVLRVRIARFNGFGVAERIFPERDDAAVPDGYPKVVRGKHVTQVEAEIGTLPAGGAGDAFREPLRIYAREQAAGRSFAVEYELCADELETPLEGRLVMRVAKCDEALPARPVTKRA